MYTANGPVTSNNIFGIRNDVLLRLLNLKIRQDNPGLTESQIASRVPLLMQELIRQMQSGDNTVTTLAVIVFDFFFK
jgi:transcriptional regulator ATRX